MKRFATAYLFITVILTLLANLFFILLYGRQFLFDAAPSCQQFCAEIDPEPSILWPLLSLNLVVLVIFVFGYFAVNLLIKPHK